MTFDFSHLTSADEVVQVAAELRQQSDEGRWMLGALVNWFAPHRRSGRPLAEEIHTISWLARAIGVPRSHLSELASCWAFWGEAHEEIPLGVSWHQASMARQRTGWRPGQKVTQESLTRAFELLEEWMEGPPKSANSVTADQYISRAIANVEKALPLLRNSALKYRAELALAALEDIGG